MKRTVRILSVILALCTILAIPSFAAVQPQSYSVKNYSVVGADCEFYVNFQDVTLVPTTTSPYYTELDCSCGQFRSSYSGKSLSISHTSSASRTVTCTVMKNAYGGSGKGTASFYTY